MAAQEQASKINEYAQIGPANTKEAASKINAYAQIGPANTKLSAAKINVYALLTTTPPPTVPRRKVGVFAWSDTKGA